MQNLRRRINPAVHSTLAKFAFALAVSLGCSACQTTNSPGSYERLYMMQNLSNQLQTSGFDRIQASPQLPMRPVIQVQQPQQQQPVFQPYQWGQ